MNLRRQTLLLLGGTLVLMAAAAVLVCIRVFGPALGQIERREASEDLEIISGVLDNSVDRLEGTTRDWAAWDETYAFMLGTNPVFDDRDLRMETFESLSLDLIAIYDTGGAPVAVRFRSGDSVQAFPPGLSELWEEGGVLSGLSLGGVPGSGLLALGGKPAAVAFHPVLTSRNEGPPAGSLVMIELLETPDGLAFYPGTLPGRASMEVLPAGSPPPPFLVGDSTVSATEILETLDGSLIALTLDKPRTISGMASSILRNVVLMVVLSGLAFSALTLVLIQMLVVRRLTALLSRIRASIDQDGTGDGEKGLDVVSRVSLAVEPILERLESAAVDLRESERRNAAILRALPDYMLVMSRDGVILSSQPGFGSAWPYSTDEVTGLDLSSFDLQGIEADRGLGLIASAIENGTVESVSFGMSIGDSTVFFDARVVALDADRVLVMVRDVTRMRRAEQEAARIQRLESLGLLAGGLAHDFNNCLSAAMGSIELASVHAEAGSGRTAADLERALDACRTAGDLTRRLLTFASGGDPVTGRVPPGPLLEAVLAPLMKASGIALTILAPADCWDLEADAEQLSQVFRNIGQNSIEALGRLGTMTVGVANTTDTEGSPLPPGRYVRMDFVDSGPGFRCQDLTRVFEPYFTTKSESRGLGLSVCHSVVLRHGGWMTALPGPGGRLRILLPALGEPAAAVDLSASARPAGRDGRTHRILVMDDDPLVLETLAEMLELLDFRVEKAANGGEAIETIAREARAGRSFDLLILDLVVPGGMGGVETLSRIRSRFGGIPAIVSSGYSSDSVMSDCAAHGFVHSLRKPFTLRQLGEAVTGVLQSGPGAVPPDPDGGAPGRPGGGDAP